MKLLRHLIIFIVIINFPDVASAAPTQFGESGLVSVPTTEITGTGHFDASLWINHSKNNDRTYSIMPLAASMGFMNRMEIFASHPNIVINEDNDGSGRGYQNIGIKFRMSGGEGSKFQSAVDAFLRQTISKNNSLNGLKDTGARLIVSYSLLRDTILHLNLGYLMVSAPVGKDYMNETLFGGAIEYTGIEKYRPFIEVDGNTRREGGSDRIQVSPGIQYFVSTNLSLMIEGGVGVTDIGPDYRIVAGLAFTNAGVKYVKAIPVIPGSRERYAESISTPEELMPEISLTSDVTGTEVVTPTPATISAELDSTLLQPPSAVGAAVMPLGKDLLTPGSALGTTEKLSASAEPPMPVLRIMTPEKGAQEIAKASLRPEIPSELPSVTFAPPMPAAKTTAKPEAKLDMTAKMEASAPEEGDAVMQGIKPIASQPSSLGTKTSPQINAELPSLGIAPPATVTVTKVGTEAPKPESRTPKETEQAKKEVIKGKKEKTGLPEKAPATVEISTPLPASSILAKTETKELKPSIKEVDTTKPETAKGSLLPESAQKPVLQESSVTEKTTPGITTADSTISGAKIKKMIVPELGKQRIVLQSDITFAFGKNDVEKSSEKILNGIAEDIKNDKGTILKVKLEGHSDNVGSAGYNKKLSYKRAESVKTYLVLQGVKPGIIYIEGFGFERPVASNDTEDGRQKNRRVDITIDYLQ